VEFYKLYFKGAFMKIQIQGWLRGNILCVELFFEKKISDSLKIKIFDNFSDTHPYCQGIRRIRIGIPGNSANVRRGILRYSPEYFRNSGFCLLVARDSLGITDLKYFRKKL
jgi:hypothetical protein